MKINMNGFTLIEAMIYVAISGIVMLAVFNFFSDSVFQEKKLAVMAETLNDASVLMHRLDVELRNSVGIDSATSDSLCLVNNKSVYSYGSTKIYFQGNSVFISRSNDKDCSHLQSSSAINSNLSLINSVVFDRISNNYGEILKYTIEFTSPKSISKSGLPSESSNFVYSSSVTLREW